MRIRKLMMIVLVLLIAAVAAVAKDEVDGVLTLDPPTAQRCLAVRVSLADSQVVWGEDDGGGAVASGVSLVRLQAAGTTHVQRVVLVR